MKDAVGIVVMLVLLAGCSSPNTDTAKIAKPTDIGKTINVAQETTATEAKDLDRVENGKIDCASINSNPKLIYFKSENSDAAYYFHIKSSEFSLSGHQLNEERNDSILLGGQLCGFGGGLGKNVNYLYCKHDSFRFHKLAADGTIIRIGFVNIQPTFNVNKSKNLSDTNGQYALVPDAKLVSQECWVTSVNSRN